MRFFGQLIAASLLCSSTWNGPDTIAFIKLFVIDLLNNSKMPKIHSNLPIAKQRLSL